MSTADPMAPRATIELSPVERDALISEARFLAWRWGDPLMGSECDSDPEALAQVIDAAHEGLGVASRVIAAVIHPDLFTKTPETLAMVLALRASSFESQAFNGELVPVDETDPGEVKDRERIETLTHLAARMEKLLSEYQGEA
jgi:hypothetical protein